MGADLPERLLSMSAIENMFQQARVLVFRREYDKAIARFKQVCSSLGHVLEENREATEEFRFIPLSLREIGQMYGEQKKDAERGLDYARLGNDFLQHMLRNRANREDEDSEDPAGPDIPLPELLGRMRSLFAKPDRVREPPLTPERVAQLVEESKKRRDEEQMRRNIEMWERAAEDRRKRVAGSRVEQLKELVANHPIAGVIGVVVFCAIFCVLALWIIEADQPEESKELRRRAMERRAAAKTEPSRSATPRAREGRRSDEAPRSPGGMNREL